jgi:pimeloyl-ACP methyl ester carboxylesterase
MKRAGTFCPWSIVAVIVIGMGPLATFAAGPQGTVYQFTVPKQGVMYADPTYYCWIPANVGTVRCIIMHQHGCTREGDAQLMMNDLQWLTFAKKWHAVFIAPKLITGAPGTGSTQCSNWHDNRNGSGNAYLMALDTLARRSGHPEIKRVPWALWGHSGGSLWITAMTALYPDRVAVAVAQSGSRDMSQSAGALRIPILQHNGKKDMIYNDSSFHAGRSRGAIWAHAINPFPLWSTGSCAPPNPLCWDTTVYGHAPHDLRMIAIPWMDMGLAARLPDVPGDSLLKPMDTSNAWLGDSATLQIAPVATFTANKTRACWFPNQTFAKMWKDYMPTKTIKDSTPPPAPYNLTGTYANRQIVLQWDADADLETGIKTFIIYRNGSVLTTLQYTTTTLFTTERGFQRWDDGDQPNPSPAPAMTYTNTNLTDTGTYTYEICTINWYGIAGAKSNTLTLKGGQVTGVAGSNGVGKVLRSAKSIYRYAGKGRLSLDAGIIDIYGIDGRMLKNIEIKSAGSIDIGSMLGEARQKVVVVKQRDR